MLNALVKAASYSDVPDAALDAVDKMNGSLGPVPASVQVNANPLYAALVRSIGGASEDAGKATMYATPRYLAGDDDVKNKAKNSVGEFVDSVVRGNKGGSAAGLLSAKYLAPLGLAAPVIGAVAGGMGDVGIGRGLLRGLGAGAGGLAGAVAGSKLGDLVQDTKFVRGLNPNLQAALSLIANIGGAGAGAYLGHKLTRAVSKTRKEEREDND